MRRFSFVATAVLAPMLGMGPMFAGVKIVSENTDLATKKVTTDTILLDANRMRLESDDGKSVMFLTDGGRNRMVMLDKAKNTYQEIDEQTMKQMGQQMSGAMAQMEARHEEHAARAARHDGKNDEGQDAAGGRRARQDRVHGERQRQRQWIQLHQV